MRTQSDLAKELDCFTEAELAALTQCTEVTLESWRKRNKGPTFMRAGNAVLYPRAAVLRWVMHGIDKREEKRASAKDLL